MEYLELKVNEKGTFDIPEENCKVKGEVVYFKIPLKVSGSDWACAINKRLCILTDEDLDGNCLVYAVSLTITDSSYSALDEIFDKGNYAEKGCGMMYGLSPRSLEVCERRINYGVFRIESK